MKPIKALAVGTLALGLTTGCSTVIKGASDDITVNSLEKGTTLYVNGAARGKDSAFVSVDKGKTHTIIEPINESYSYNEAPAQFCGPICSFSDLNTAVTDSEGNTLSLFHAKDSGRFTVIKGDIIATATKNVDALAAD